MAEYSSKKNSKIADGTGDNGPAPSSHTTFVTVIWVVGVSQISTLVNPALHSL